MKILYHAFLISFVFFFLAGPQIATADSGGLSTFVAVDLVGEAFVRSRETSSKEAQIRGAEVFFAAPIDPVFDGTLGIAAHPEGGVSHFELHEATISSSKLLPYTQIRLGQGFLSIGKLNRVHQHDWPFIEAPKVHTSFFDSEGVNDVLLEGTVNTPTELPLEFTLGVAKGWVYGHAHNEGKRPLVPTHYSRVQSFFELPGGGGLQFAGNYLGRTDSNARRTRLMGLDITAKWREGRALAFFLQSEIWLRQVKNPGVDREDTMGLYVFPQFNVTENVDFGIRGDSYSVLSSKDALGNKIENASSEIVPTVTYKPSEFSTFRLAYSWQLEQRGNEVTRVADSRLQAQITFILGSHPSHDF